MQFFLDKIAANPDDPVYAHFELVPDHLPEALKETIAQFPPGALQFEIGIQSFNPEVQALVSRRQDNAKAADNIRWLCDALARPPARGPDRRPAGRRRRQLRARLRPAGRPRPARDPVRHPEAPARHADHPPHGAVQDGVRPVSARTPCWPPTASTSPPCSAWCALPATGTWSRTPAASPTRSRCCWATPVRQLHGVLGLDLHAADATHRIALDRLAKLVQAWLQRQGMERSMRPPWWPAITPAASTSRPRRRCRPKRRRPSARSATWPRKHARHRTLSGHVNVALVAESRISFTLPQCGLKMRQH
jgi:hypothetical protein